ncbi:MAG: ion transporter [SAR324 cluster bacterium]|nr:ion transporter [SAR324 cluster bacterium]
MKHFFDAEKAKQKHGHRKWQTILHEIIFEAETPAGKLFDVLLMVNIGLSVLTVMLDSVAAVREVYGDLLYGMEWFFTILFSIEYVLRLFCVGKPILYATSFFGIIDLLAILPTYLALFLPGTHYLTVIRILRVLRVFRVLKLVTYLGEANLLLKAMHASRRKVEVFLYAVLAIVIVFGSIMYVIEGEEHGFTSIPRGIYWAIVTLTTVGYGDISPQTDLGQTLASFIMILGYAIIAVPTGIVTAEITLASKQRITTRVCRECAAEGHDTDAKCCKFCGTEL